MAVLKIVSDEANVGYTWKARTVTLGTGRWRQCRRRPGSSTKQTKSERDVRFKAKKELSLSSLILWNIEKVFEKNTSIDLKEAIKNAYESLDRDCDIKVMLSQRPEEQHLACAVLAWQRLGHSRVESLYQ
ncbi:unnamed protein product [Colias eurytheme]|nr:unnamed protein product [Colias eurytheme]